ncbi:hypothetical protein [Acidovorax sp. 99]|uniref:hypothetical protein n=1 Tax=Acidovorax sp. 99 TaxID=2135634 RepID=UPI0010578915|nr:hypothetical protein [Acidovorax sp. 99]
MRLVFSSAWLAWMLIIAMRQVIRFFPAPDAEINGDAYWTYLPNARFFLADPWSFLTREPSSFYVAPLSYIWPAIWNANPAVIQVANGGLYLLSVLLMWRLATRLGGVGAGMVATALLVRFPELASYIPQVLTEPLYMFGLLLFLTGLVDYVLAEQRRLFWLTVAATGLAVTLLTRPVLQLFSVLALAALLCLFMVRRTSTDRIPSLERVVNESTVIALALALSLPILTVVKNGTYFGYWGISTGAGSGLFYGVSPFKMGVEPVYGGFGYDAGITARMAAPATQGHPLHVEADQIQSRAALSIIQSTRWRDNVAFFWFKFKAWMLYSPEDTAMRPKLRQFRLFEWLSIGGATACLAYRQWRARKRALLRKNLPIQDGVTLRRLGLCTFILLLAIGMAGQLLPVLYNIRYNVFLLDLLLIPLAGVGVAIMAKQLCANASHYGLHSALQFCCGIVLVSLLMALTGALSRSNARDASWSMDPRRPGPTELVLGSNALGTPTLSNARLISPGAWELSAPATLSIPLTLDQPLNFMDGIWRFKLAIAVPHPSRQCMDVTVSLDQPSAETHWYVPRPILHVKLDGKSHLYAIRGNGALRPSNSGSLNLLFRCPEGTVVQWHGAQLLRSSMPEAARALVTDGEPINPYRADDIWQKN